MILRVPHPLRFVQRVGSYDRTLQTFRSFFSSLVAGRWPLFASPAKLHLALSAAVTCVYNPSHDSRFL